MDLFRTQPHPESAKRLSTVYLIGYFGFLCALANRTLALTVGSGTVVIFAYLLLLVGAIYLVFTAKRFYLLASAIVALTGASILPWNGEMSVLELGLSLLAGVSLYVSKDRYFRGALPREVVIPEERKAA